ncbi:hypothetical protein [uncultured Treponema sp.]|uniref:hypothetical protein n=1 Tax=uncultured Treponema sp. TaxID=162155 RepID=UPI0025E6AF36|nr:hypothetical protein [uncultured Treponema sp.]
MATTSNILTLLKFNCSKQKTDMLEYGQFADYVHRYAQHHIEENSALESYCTSDYKVALEAEINSLVADRQVVISSIRNKDYIFVVPYFIEKYNDLFNQIDANISIPFPSINDMPKIVPIDVVTKKQADEIIYGRLDKEELNDRTLYCIVFSKTVPSLIFPSSFPIANLINLALKKIQELMHKEESHDYFLKKLSISNPGKELSIKTFFNQFCANPSTVLDILKNTGDNFYYWSQLCYFIKQDYTKLKDFAPEDITILQSVAIIEIATSYYKSKAAEKLQAQAAFEQLDILMKNPPYYYNLNDIRKMKDKTGIPLLGQYKEEQLMNHLKAKTQESIGNQMPELLIFKVNDGNGYYIFKERVIPLIIRLANDVRILVREALIKSWYNNLREYELLPEMKENAAFERCLEREVSSIEPVLSALLNASFLPVVAFEDQTPGHITLFRNDSLISYSELLMLSRQELLADAKLKLPFWYAMPIVSFIMKLLFKKPKPKTRKDASAALKIQNELKEKESEILKRRDEDDSIDPKNTRRRELRKLAVEIEKEFVPESSTLDRELKGYMHEWNDRIGKQNYENLGEDVNSLIRDYFRKVLRTLKADTFNAERIQRLAESLVDTPSMMKIKNHPALKRYVELYIIKIVKNLPSN